MPHFKVNLLSKAQDVLCRVLRINYGRGSFETPIRVLNVHQEGRFLASRGIRGIAEIYLQFSFKRIEELSGNYRKQEELARRIRTYISRYGGQNMTILIPSIEDRPDRAPSLPPKDLGCYIAELMCFPDVDLVTMPIFYRVNEKLIPQIIDGFLEATSAFKTNIALALPEVSRECKKEILHLYQEHMERNSNLLINFICMDYNGSNPINKHVDHNLLMWIVNVLEREYEENVIVYGINVKYSKVGRKYERITARDLLAPYLGVDIIGPNHRRPIIAKEIAETLRKVPYTEKKVLDIDRYLYVNLEVCARERKDARVKGLARASYKLMSKKAFGLLLNVYNASEYLVELNNVRSLINEGVSLYDYVTHKEGLVQDNTARARMDTLIRNIARREKRIDEYLK